MPTVVESFWSYGSAEFDVTHYDYSSDEDLTWEFTRDDWYNSDDYLVVTFHEGFAVETNYDYVEVYTASGLFDVIENDGKQTRNKQTTNLFIIYVCILFGFGLYICVVDYGNIVSTSNAACTCPLPCTFYTGFSFIHLNI